MTEKLLRTSLAAVPMFLFAAAAWAQPAPGGAAPAKTDQCVACHTDLEGRLGEPVKAMQKDDIHGQHGLSCANCHGGDRTQESRKAAMDPAMTDSSLAETSGHPPVLRQVPQRRGLHEAVRSRRAH